MKSLALSAGTLAAAALLWYAVPSLAESARRVPAPTVDLTAAAAAKTENAVFAGGCFWGVEHLLQKAPGVLRATAGYTGGTTAQPTYRKVCEGTTGHAEAVEVLFDARATSYEALARLFFEIHDPTTLNRQGADVGSQYRSVIFYHHETQRLAAEAMIAELEAAGRWSTPIVTQVAPFEAFYPAEAYHQQYFRKNPAQPYCRAVVAPKVTKLQAHFPAFLR